MAMIQGTSASTSCVKPRTKPISAAPRSSRITKMSSADIQARLAVAKAKFQPLSPEDLIHERAQVIEAGKRNAVAPGGPQRRPGALEAKLRRFLEPKAGMGDRPAFA